MLKNKLKKAPKGFTLIEILVVIGIIAILATIVIVAINPARQFGQANDTTRVSNVNTILNAIGQNMADNKGQLGGACAGITIPVDPAASSTITSGTTGTGLVDLSCLVPTYITVVPMDPVGGTAADTKYKIRADVNGRISVGATPQIAPAIYVIR